MRAESWKTAATNFSCEGHESFNHINILCNGYKQYGCLMTVNQASNLCDAVFFIIQASLSPLVGSSRLKGDVAVCSTSPPPRSRHWWWLMENRDSLPEWFMPSIIFSKWITISLSRHKITPISWSRLQLSCCGPPWALLHIHIFLFFHNIGLVSCSYLADWIVCRLQTRPVHNLTVYTRLVWMNVYMHDK